MASITIRLRPPALHSRFLVCLQCLVALVWFGVACAVRLPLANGAEIPPFDPKMLLPTLPRVFAHKSFAYHAASGEARTVNYRLFTPDSVGSKIANKKWPLLIYLHGYGEAGDDNLAHLRWLDMLFPDDEVSWDLPCFVVASQCPKDHPLWAGNGIDDPLTLLKAIVDDLMTRLPIDRECVYVSGISSGGNGVWEMMLRYPELFAAGAPLASGGAEAGKLSRITHVPIWAFHTHADPDFSVDAVRRTVSGLRDLGGKAWLTETPGEDHNCWNAAYHEFGLMKWLLAQKKGGEGPAPDYKHANVTVQLWMQDLARRQPQYYLVVPAIGVGCWLLIRRKLRRKQSGAESTIESVD